MRTTVPRIYELQLKRCVHAAGKVVCDEFLEEKKASNKIKEMLSVIVRGDCNDAA